MSAESECYHCAERKKIFFSFRYFNFLHIFSFLTRYQINFAHDDKNLRRLCFSFYMSCHEVASSEVIVDDHVISMQRKLGNVATEKEEEFCACHANGISTNWWKNHDKCYFGAYES